MGGTTNCTLPTVNCKPTSGDRVKKTKAKAMLRGKIMLVITSACSRALSATGPMKKAVIEENMNAVVRGFTAIATPKAAPAKAPWDIQ